MLKKIIIPKYVNEQILVALVVRALTRIEPVYKPKLETDFHFKESYNMIKRVLLDFSSNTSIRHNRSFVFNSAEEDRQEIKYGLREDIDKLRFWLDEAKQYRGRVQSESIDSSFVSLVNNVLICGIEAMNARYSWMNITPGASSTALQCAQSQKNCMELAQSVINQVGEFHISMHNGLIDDIDNLKWYIQNNKNGYKYLDKRFFLLRPTFSYTDEIEADLSNGFSEGLRLYFIKHPDTLYNLTPRKFEELIAGILRGFGYLVELTPQTRDGGYDIITIQNNLISKKKYLIECKRFSKDNYINVGIVRGIHSAIVTNKATGGIIVSTTDRLSTDASKLIKGHEWEIEAKGLSDIIKWLENYDEFGRINYNII